MAAQIIRNGTLIDGNGGEPIANGAVLVEDGQITAVGKEGTIRVPDGAVEIDAGGGGISAGPDRHPRPHHDGGAEPPAGADDPLLAELLPGDHLHAPHPRRRDHDRARRRGRGPGGEDGGRAGADCRARMQISISVLSTTGGHGDGWMPSGNEVSLFRPYPGFPDGICDGPEEVRRKVREILRAGAEVIKVCSTGGVGSPTDHPDFTQFSPEELAIMVQEGQYRRGIKVMAHAQGVEGIKNAVRAGIHSIEHGFSLDDEALGMMLERGTFLVPTLVAPLGVLESATVETRPRSMRCGRQRRRWRNTGRASRGPTARGEDRHGHRRGGCAAPGTNLRELGLMCDIGMSPMERSSPRRRSRPNASAGRTASAPSNGASSPSSSSPGLTPCPDIRSLEQTANIALVMKGGQLIDIRNA